MALLTSTSVCVESNATRTKVLRMSGWISLTHFRFKSVEREHGRNPLK